MGLGKISKIAKGGEGKAAPARSPVVPVSEDVKKEEFRAKRRKLRDLCLELRSNHREQERLKNAKKLLIDGLDGEPGALLLLQEVGDNSKSFTLDDGTIVEIKTGGGGRSATKGKIVEYFKEDGETFWNALEPGESEPYVSITKSKTVTPSGETEEKKE